MQKREYFLKALRANACKRKHWVMSVFTLIMEDEGAFANDPYPYRLVRLKDEVVFIDPERNGEWVAISDARLEEPLFEFKGKLKLDKGDLLNLGESLVTTAGQALVNQLTLVMPFHDKVPYLSGRISAKQLEALVARRLVDDPETLPIPTDSDWKGGVNAPIYVSEYLLFAKAVSSLVSYTQLCVPAATAKAVTVHPDTYKFKAELIEKHKDQLHDPTVVAKIEAELIKFDREWLKGDESMGFFIDKKSIDLKRKKAMIIHGAESSFKEGNDIDFVGNALNEGWDTSKMPAMMDSLREGSYSRGKETAKGGTVVKTFMRIFQNTKITMDDCGSKLGRAKSVTDDNYSRLVGYYRIVNGAPKLLDESTLKGLVGKQIDVRSPMYCLASGTGFCARCMGDPNAENPTGLSAAASAVGSTLMDISMSAAHAKALQVAKWDYKKMLK